ncbi:hypothetical protein BH10PAT1_BH10PAT1_2280 [soil metagenome]
MANKKYHSSSKDDHALMLLAACAAIIVGFFAIFSFKSQSMALRPTPTPNPVYSFGLTPLNKSGESGMVSFSEVDGKVMLALSMKGFANGVTQPVNIHPGTCASWGAIKYPLTSLLNGSSLTTLDVTMADLKTAGTKWAVVVRKSVPSSSTAVSCGEINL